MAVATATRTHHSVGAATWQRAEEAVRALLVLGKARVVGLVTFTAVAASVVAAEGRPAPSTLLAVALVGLLAGGGAGAINHVLDRDLDRRMPRTCRRPLATGQLAPRVVAVAGIASLLAGLLVAWRVGPAVALHTAVAAATYVVLYTRVLKRHTPQSVVVGGWTGAAAVLAGWAAGGGPLTIAGIALAAVVFLWTPAHFWALSIARLDEYRAAGIPCLPVVAGVPLTTRAIVGVAGLTTATAAAPLLLGEAGAVYAGGALVAAAVWLVPLWRLARAPTAVRAWHAYKASGLFLLTLFAAALVDGVVRGGG